MNKKLITFLLAFFIMIIGKSEAITLTQKLGDTAISATVNVGQEITLRFNNKANYTFENWTVESENVVVSKTSPIITFIMPNENVVIRANYREESLTGEEAQYTLTYDANGGTVFPGSKTVTYGDTYGDLSIATREGYIFAGWYTAKSGGTKVTSSTKVTTPGDHTIYAQWNIIYTLTYNANGGSGAPSAQTGTTLTISGTIPTKSDYTFKGWSTSSSATSVSYNAGDSITITKNTTLYAVWSRTYTLTYNAKDGYFGAAHSSAETYTIIYPNNSINVTLKTTTPTREGYEFVGWGAYSTTSDVYMQPREEITLTGNKTIYAYWTAKKYTVSFDGNGVSVIPPVKNVTYDSTYGDLPTPTRPGYTFNGWYYAGNNITSSTILKTSQNHTLTASWTANPTYTLTYNANGGSGAPSSQTGTTLTIRSTTPTRSGYTFKGWSKSSSATSASYSAGGSITLSSNTTLYAVWEQNTTTYTLTYNANGGSRAPETQTGTGTGISYTFTISGTKPTRSGYTFKGWSTSSNATSVSYNAGESITITKNTTLYAQWEIKEYTLNYDANGGKWETITRKSETMTIEDEDYAISNVIPTREGYEFKYWTTGTSNVLILDHYDPGQVVEVTDLFGSHSDEITLYAWWEMRDFTKTNTSDNNENNNEYWVVFKYDNGKLKTINGVYGFYVKGGGKCEIKWDNVNSTEYVWINNEDNKVYPGTSGMFVEVIGNEVRYYANGHGNEYSVSLNSCVDGDKIVFRVGQNNN